MQKIILSLILMICLISILISGVTADSTSQSDNSQTLAVASICNQPYALCDTAFCIPDQNDPSKMRCSCTVENGSSVGKPCDEWKPVGMYYDDYWRQWMIKAGYSVGQVTSTYSFAHAAPIEGNEIDPNNTPAGYTGDVYMKSCSNATGNGVWADCWDAPCTVLPKDINADINVDRPASQYAVCDCGLMVNQSEWDIAVHGTDLCDNKTLCNNFIISGASIPTTKVGMYKLADYLRENPGVDSSQPYEAAFCENCTNCESNTSAGL